MKLQVVFATLCCTFSAFTVSNAQSATGIFHDDFSSGHVHQNGNPYIGGWFNSQVAFKQWTASRGNAQITAGTLDVTSTSDTRSAALVLSPSAFAGAGDYELQFDIKSFKGGANNELFAAVWAGSGYDLSKKTGNALIVDTYTGALRTEGSASSELLANGSYIATADGNSLKFRYDGSSAIAIFLGAKTKKHPFPEGSFDNVSITKIDVIPEPSVTALLGLALSSLLFVRRREV